MSLLSIELPVKAAERISVFTPIGEFDISVQSLETFATEGKIDKELKFYTQRLSHDEMASLRELLQKRIKINHVQVSRFLYSSVGELLLNYLGEHIQTDANLNGFYALRSSLVLAAINQDGLNLIDVLKEYPSPTIRINPDVLFKIYGSLEELYEKTNQISDFLQQSEVDNSYSSSESASLPQINLQQSGSFSIEKQKLYLYDQERERSLTTDLYLPIDHKNAPVMIISHGFGSARDDFAYLAEHLTSHGFAVAVIQHPGSDRQQLESYLQGTAKDILQVNDFIDRPQDISFLINQLERLEEILPDIQSRFNLQQIGVIGHSFGGYTGLALAGAKPNFDVLTRECSAQNFNLNVGNASHLLQCLALDLPEKYWPDLTDKRVKAVFTINPIGASIFGEKGVENIEIPIMMVASSDDAIAPALLEQVCPFSWLNSPHKYLAFIENSTHSDATQSTTPSRINIIDELDSPDPKLARNYLKTMSLAFAKTYIALEGNYKNYLQNSYTQTISKSAMPLTLINSLTKNQLSQELKITCPASLSD
ncbi:alpha/beta hydrolase [Alkalinema pantanalense CENA528]|uniref:alpha/beta hydrolase n=1 Tax=Alkalinema pantanalense TaxID=1620705 RepID=UPI003D6FC366